MWEGKQVESTRLYISTRFLTHLWLFWLGISLESDILRSIKNVAAHQALAYRKFISFSKNKSCFKVKLAHMDIIPFSNNISFSLLEQNCNIAMFNYFHALCEPWNEPLTHPKCAKSQDPNSVSVCETRHILCVSDNASFLPPHREWHDLRPRGLNFRLEGRTCQLQFAKAQKQEVAARERWHHRGRTRP